MKKDTFFNNSTEAEVQGQGKGKRKFLKTFSFSALALLMGTAGVFAFAPLGAGAQGGALASASEMVDQINTKADGENIKYAPSPLGLDPENDPVIYTTESGLEIKYGGLDVNASLGSGNLKGYPYITMGTYNGYAVNWVIIGRAPDTNTFNSSITSFLFSTWTGKTNYNYNKYFLSNVYETITPAGTAIKTTTSSKSYVMDNYSVNLSHIVNNSEIPSGCVLAFSECCLGYSYFNSTSAANSTYDSPGSNNTGGRYRYRSSSTYSNTTQLTLTYSTTGSTLYTNVTNLYSSKLGLTDAQKNLIQPQKLNTLYTNNTTPYLDTYSTDGNTLYNLFPLAGYKDYNGGYTGSTPGNENFILTTYLKKCRIMLLFV